MESEKVKEIKEKLKERYYYLDQAYSDHLAYGGKADEQQEEEIYFLGDIRTLINELESENERLNKSDTSKEESSIEYYNLYKDLKRKNKDLNELCELQRVSIAENFVKENQLKDRIAELEKGNEALSFAVKQGFNDCQKKTLKQFVEMLKEKAVRIYEDDTLRDFILEYGDVEDTLKECLND